MFVYLLKDPPKPELPKPEPPKSKPQPVKLERPIEPPPPQQLAAQGPVVLPTEPVRHLPPSEPPSKIDATVEPAPPPTPPAKSAGPVMLGGSLAVACPERTLPAYPAVSRRLGEAGKPVLKVELDEAGQVDRATIQKSSGYARLDDAALSAVKRWRCNPAKRDGVAVRAVAIQPFNFVLEGR